MLFLLDVIEHVEDVRAFLKDVLFHMKPGATLIVNVPALPLLFSPYDKAAGHYRRYTKETLKAEFAELPVKQLDMRFWGFSLLPLALARRVFTGNTEETSEVLAAGFKPPLPGINRLFHWIGKMEIATLPQPPLGTSLVSAYQVL